MPKQNLDVNKVNTAAQKYTRHNLIITSCHAFQPEKRTHT
jgi:hypothetical protein